MTIVPANCGSVSFTMATARVADVECSANEVRVVLQQASHDAQLKPGMVKLEVWVEHSVPNLSHFEISGGEAGQERDWVELKPAQMPGAVFAERGEATIAARAVNAFGKHTAASELDVCVGLSASHAASLISAAARGYLVRHAPELGHVRDAIKRARRS